MVLNQGCCCMNVHRQRLQLYLQVQFTLIHRATVHPPLRQSEPACSYAQASCESQHVLLAIRNTSSQTKFR